MHKFDWFADRVSEVFASSQWFAFCAALVFLWVMLGFVMGWTNELFHLMLNSPTTAMTFLGLFVLHNAQHRFERATNKRLQEIIDKLPATDDPVDDPGQKPRD